MQKRRHSRQSKNPFHAYGKYFLISPSSPCMTNNTAKINISTILDSGFYDNGEVENALIQLRNIFNSQ